MDKKFSLVRRGQQHVLTVEYPDGHVEAMVLTPSERRALEAAVALPEH